MEKDIRGWVIVTAANGWLIGNPIAGEDECENDRLEPAYTLEFDLEMPQGHASPTIVFRVRPILMLISIRRVEMRPVGALIRVDDLATPERECLSAAVALCEKQLKEMRIRLAGTTVPEEKN